MTTVTRLLTFALLWLSLCCQNKQATDGEQALLYRITDYADILTTAQEDSLTGIMEDLERRIGSQIAVLTVPALNGQTIEALSLTTARAAGLGRATHNDGVLITIAHEDRQMRIEVGTGLENIINDEIAARIIREDMAPKFREEKFGAGLYLAIEKICKLIVDNETKVGQAPE